MMEYKKYGKQKSPLSPKKIPEKKLDEKAKKTTMRVGKIKKSVKKINFF